MSPKKDQRLFKNFSTVVASSALMMAVSLGGTGTAAAEEINGEAVFKGRCINCHNASMPRAGAPALADKEAWAPRIAQGIETLYDHALNGTGMMPPKGGDTSLSDDEVKAAVDYMVKSSQ